MNRRHFLLLSAASLWAAARAGASDRRDEVLSLWPAEPPGRRAIRAPRLSARGALTHIVRPQLAVWRPAQPRGHGVLIAAGAATGASKWRKRPACRALADGTRLYRLRPELPASRRRVGRRRAGAVAGRPAGAAVDSRAGRTGQPARVFRRRAFAGYGGLPGRFCRLFAAGCSR